MHVCVCIVTSVSQSPDLVKYSVCVCVCVHHVWHRGTRDTYIGGCILIHVHTVKLEGCMLYFIA